MYWAALLGPESCSFTYVCHNAWSFGLTLRGVGALPGLDRGVAVVPWVVLGPRSRIGGGFLDAYHIYLFSEGDL